MKHVICVHTAMALVEPLPRIFQELIPEVTVNHIADSSLIKEVIANNQVTAAVRRRLLSYYNAAADAGADVVFNTCSSVGDVADYGNQYARIPVFRIDQPMAAEAVSSIFGRLSRYLPGFSCPFPSYFVPLWPQR